MAFLKKRNLDVRKIMEFGSEEVFVMVSMSTGVDTRLMSLFCASNKLMCGEASKNIEPEKTCKKLNAIVNPVGMHL